MTVFEQIKKLSKSRNITMKDLALKLGFSENLFYTWKKTNPKATDLAKVADYFHVSVDYLLGREDKEDEIKNPEIRILARDLDNNFDDEQIEEFKTFAQYLKHKKFGSKKDGKI